MTSHEVSFFYVFLSVSESRIFFARSGICYLSIGFPTKVTALSEPTESGFYHLLPLIPDLTVTLVNSQVVSLPSVGILNATVPPISTAVLNTLAL